MERASSMSVVTEKVVRHGTTRSGWRQAKVIYARRDQCLRIRKMVLTKI